MPHIDFDISSAVIVASGSFLNQTSVSPTFTIFTPSANGVFRVTSATNFISGPGPIGIAVVWTDNQGTHTGTGASLAATVTTVFALAGTPIQLVGNGPAGITYDIHWFVEQLG